MIDYYDILYFIVVLYYFIDIIDWVNSVNLKLLLQPGEYEESMNNGDKIFSVGIARKGWDVVF